MGSLEQFRNLHGEPPALLAKFLAFMDEQTSFVSGRFEPNCESAKDMLGDPALAECFAVFGQEGDGSLFALWRHDSDTFEDAPVAYLNSECSGNGVVADNFADFLALLALNPSDVGQAANWGNFTEYDAPVDARPEFLVWLEKTGIAPADKPKELVAKARKKHPDVDEWIEAAKKKAAAESKPLRPEDLPTDPTKRLEAIQQRIGALEGALYGELEYGLDLCVSDSGFAEAAALLQTLPPSKLKVTLNAPCPASVAALPGLADRITALTVESAGDPSAADALFAGLPTLPKVAWLSVSAPVSDAGLAHLHKLPAVTSAQFYSAAATDSGLAHIGARTDLDSLTLWGPRTRGAAELAPPPLGTSELSASGFSAWGKLKKLTSVGLARHRLAAGALGGLSAMPMLDGLDLEGIASSGSVTEGLESLAQLKRMRIQSVELQPADLARLAGCPKLADLTLQSLELSSACLAALTGLTNIRSLCLSGVAIGDTGTATLAAMTNLTQLSLYMTGVTREGLSSLTPLKELRSLSLQDPTLPSETAAEVLEEIKAARK